MAKIVICFEEEELQQMRCALETYKEQLTTCVANHMARALKATIPQEQKRGANAVDCTSAQIDMVDELINKLNRNGKN